MKERIIKTLEDEFLPHFLEVKNNSHLHQGHAGDNGTGETHFEVIISASSLDDVTRVNAHRKVNAVLKSQFDKGLHALEIKIIKTAS